MKPRIPVFEENLKKIAGRVSEDLSAIEEFTKDLDSPLDAGADEELRREEFLSVENPDWAKKDGSFNLRLSGDAMTCVADFHPPSPDGAPVTVEAVQRKLLEMGVVYGLDWDLIGESILACNTEGRDVLEVVIARGTPPVDEVPAHYALHERFQRREIALENDRESVDYRTWTPFVLVKKGDLLGVEVPGKGGKTGCDVGGNKIPFAAKNPAGITGKRNTDISKDGIAAAVDGMAKVRDGEVWVEEVLHITGNVDYHTGHIDFPGDIIIDGVVADDFNVFSAGSIFCKKTLNASNVRAKEDLFTRGGIIGRGDALVSAGGKVKAKFLERCNLEAGDDVFSEIGAINSVVQTLGKFTTSTVKGIVIGGKVYAQNGMEVFNIGTPSSPKSEIICGINHQVLRKLEWIKEKNLDFALQLREVKKTLDFSSKSRPDLVAMRKDLLAGIHKLNEAARILVNRLTKNEDARVVVYGSVIPGTYIEICNVSYIVNRPLKRVFFFLDKEKGRVEAAQIRNP